MKRAGQFLSKFDSLTPPHDALRTALVSAIMAHVGKKISKSLIRIDQNIAFISVPSIVKSVIRVRRAEILRTVYEEIPRAKDMIRDIR